VPSYFTDVCTDETWEQAKARGWKISGYFESTFENVRSSTLAGSGARSHALPA